MEMKMIMTTSNNCLNLSREKSKRVRLLAGKNVFLSVFLRDSRLMRASDGSGTYRAVPDACISAKTWMVG